MEEPAQLHVGDYVVRLEEDVVYVRGVGIVTVQIARDLVMLLRQVKERHGHFFIIGDLREAGTIHPEARRVFIEFGTINAPLATAFYGVSLMVRGVNALLFGAANLIGKQRQNMRQFSTEQEARTWIAAERRRLLEPKG